MNRLRLAWRELTRPRGHKTHRFYRVGRSSRAGVALLMVIAAITLLSVITTEIAYAATVRMKLSAHHRDEVAAEALAVTGVNLYRLILMASKQIGKNPYILEFGAVMGINADTLWQMVPFINTGMARMVFVSGGDMPDDDEVARLKSDGLSEEERDETREGRRNFLDFDGDFSASVMDETQHIFVGNMTAGSMGDLLELPQVQELQGLMASEEHVPFFNDNDLDRLELIANLVDWTDPDDTRLFQGGDEAAPYRKLDIPYLPKNAAFDTKHEIRLVEGWHLDGVWERFGRHLTIYGHGKVNVNTARQPVMRGLLMAFLEGYTSEAFVDQALQRIMAARGTPVNAGGVHFSSAQHFKSWVETDTGASLRKEILQGISTEALTFRIEAAGEVGESRVEIHTVIDFSQNSTGQVLYWRVL
jgi:type II secretory pathway component PulK